LDPFTDLLRSGSRGVANKSTYSRCRRRLKAGPQQQHQQQQRPHAASAAAAAVATTTAAAAADAAAVAAADAASATATSGTSIRRKANTTRVKQRFKAPHQGKNQQTQHLITAPQKGD